jgi:hypothetical protein
MSYIIDRIGGEPIIVVTFCADFHVGTEMALMTAELHEMVNQIGQGVTIINNLVDASFSLNEVIEAANLARRQEVSLFHHPNVRQIVGVSSSKLITLSAKGLGHATFGSLSLPMFASIDEALDYARG